VQRTDSYRGLDKRQLRQRETKRGKASLVQPLTHNGHNGGHKRERERERERRKVSHLAEPLSLSLLQAFLSLSSPSVSTPRALSGRCTRMRNNQSRV